MVQKLTLQQRIFLISSLLVVVAFAMVWIFVRPGYKEAIINERTTVVSQLQEYSLKRADKQIRDWLNATNYLAEGIVEKPAEVQSLVQRGINLTPGLMKIELTDIQSNETLEMERSIYSDVNYQLEGIQWIPALQDERIYVSWVPSEQTDVDFFLTQRTIQVGENVFSLVLFFNVRTILTELIQIPLGDGQYEASIVFEDGTNLLPSTSISFPSTLVGDASFVDTEPIELNGDQWFAMSTRFQTIPFWHLIAVEESFILKPVNDLVLFTSLSSASILLLMLLFSFYVSFRINKPVASLIGDVEVMSNLEFDKPVAPIALPEFGLMRDTLEHIRTTLQRYQKLNVEKIILEEWKNRYMMTYSEDFIGILDGSGTFSFVNNNLRQFFEQLKLNPNQTVLDDFLSSSPIHLEIPTQTMHYPDPYVVTIDQAELRHIQEDETTYYFDYQLLRIIDRDANQVAAFLILHDKTEDRLLDIKRNDMINIIVHELKNPITGVVGLSKLMLDNTSFDEPTRNELLREVFLSGERMNALVNRFLEVQRLESGRLPVEFRHINLHEIVEDVKTVLNPLLSEKKLDTKVIPHGDSFEIEGSKDLAFDAIQNIVSNAIKYGDENRTIELELTEDKEHIKIGITDHGFGISIEDQKKVFDKFFRVKSNPKAAKEKGTGLGLAYVKEIMNRHAGDITLESNSKIGSKFTLIFPKKQQAA
ncbi:MAG: HAMP domain-containing sensor histidine kinase [Bacteroidota bacterium]